jgi:hypothetical protein
MMSIFLSAWNQKLRQQKHLMLTASAQLDLLFMLKQTYYENNDAAEAPHVDSLHST